MIKMTQDGTGHRAGRNVNELLVHIWCWASLKVMTFTIGLGPLGNFRRSANRNATSDLFKTRTF